MSTRQARTADKSTNDKHTRILKALLQKPGNKFCVDCRKKGSCTASTKLSAFAICTSLLVIILQAAITNIHLTLLSSFSFVMSVLAADPRWASFNLGCFMCIRCSGVHRSMGTHISKVKSVDLDSWTVEQVENMIKWGNEKANMYWEARLPERSIPNESMSGIDPWIRSKYEHKQFAQKGGLPDPSELGPIDEAMLMDLYGKAEPDSRTKAHMSRSSESSGGFSGVLAPPPANPTRSSFPKKPTSSGVQGADLFSIGQRAPAKASPAPAQEDFFGFNDPVPAPVQKASNPGPSSAAQDLFSMATPASTQAAPAPAAAAATATPAKTGNADWKTNIMSLYGAQSSAPKPNTNSNGFGQLQGMDAFGFGQAPAQQQQQQQQQQHNPWGNDDGFGAMQQASAPTSNSSFDAFGMSSNQNNSSNGFGGANNNGFGSFGNNNGFGGAANNNNNNNNNGGFGAFQNSGFGGAQNNNNNAGFNNGFGGANNNGFGGAGNNNNSMPQGGDLFNLLAGAARSPTATPQSNSNKNSSAFGDLSWN
ncbi:hypothetical protein EC991_000518 [Linnemannia zychae]|nr:hypothetical protein EC991_000518 [Linnemannia zychae]